MDTVVFWFMVGLVNLLVAFILGLIFWKGD